MRTPTIVFALLVWVCIVSTGLWAVWHYDRTPGAKVSSPINWPLDTRIERVQGCPTLVMFVHPRCPCTFASIAELERLMARCAGAATTHIWFLHPRGAGHDWTDAPVLRRAAVVSGVCISADEDGNEAQRFGVRTSGHVLVYDAEGRCVFSGGITAGRGNHGNSLGQEAIVAFLTAGACERRQTPVFGCPLFAFDSQTGAERTLTRE